jgi:hypothetical protein
VHAGQVGALDLDHVVAVAFEKLTDLGRVLAAQHGRPGDLGAVQVQDRQHRPVTLRVEERDTLPRALQGPGLGLTVTDHRDRQQVGVVHHRAERVDQHVTQLAALVDRAGRGHRHVAGDAAGAGELPEQPQQPRLVLADLRVDLAVGALQVARGDQRRPAVARPGQIDRLLAGVPDQPGHVRVDQRQAGAGPPVPEQPRLDVLGGQRLPQQRVGPQVDLADGQVVVGPPPGVEPGQVGLVGLGEGGQQF